MFYIMAGIFLFVNPEQLKSVTDMLYSVGICPFLVGPIDEWQ